MSRSVEVHQLVPSVVPGDATTGHTLAVQTVLRRLGYRSEVYATAVHPDLETKVRLLHELKGPARRDRFLLYQLSAQSSIVDWLLGRLEVIGVDYHNVTPASFLRRWDRHGALALRSAEVEVAQLGRVATLGVCDSVFNAQDLRAKGWRSTAVAPVLVDFDQFGAEPDPETSASLRRLRDARPGAAWLFVGALAPHKAQHRLVEAFACYRRAYDPGATLQLVGRAVTTAYAAALARLVEVAGLADAVRLTGGVTHAALVAHYQHADVYVSASEHEGFGVPLLEALHHGVPVVARRAGAVADTLGDAGVVLERPSPSTFAGAVHRVVTDTELRGPLAAAAAVRLDALSLQRTSRIMGDVLGRWVAAGGAPVATVPEAAGAVR